MSSQVVAVIGASGAQGFSVVRSLVDTHPIRAFTRNPDKFKLTHPNLSVVQVDLSDTAAVKDALRGVWAVFVNTFSDYSKPSGAEEELGKSIVDAALEAGVEWLVYSSLPEHMPFGPFVEKANVMVYAREVAKRSSLKNVFVQMGDYMTNQKRSPPIQAADGVVEFRYSIIDDKTYFPLISSQTDTGPIVKAILENPEKWRDQEIPIVGEALTLPQMAEIYSKVYGIPARAVILDHVPQEKLLGGWVEMHRRFRDPGYFPAYVGREHELNEKAKKLYPGLKTWAAWLKEEGLDFVKEQ